ncbi:hypothetical protein Ddc_13108 [Ditylenchus destructor]|nr:hypothetical protein Ddc_13108 [Ditylenchus destructor]
MEKNCAKAEFGLEGNQCGDPSPTNLKVQKFGVIPSAKHNFYSSKPTNFYCQPTKNRKKRSNLMHRLSNWFEDHLPLRGRRSESRRAEIHQRNSDLNKSGKKKEKGSYRTATIQPAHKTSRSAVPPLLRYSSNASEPSWNYSYGKRNSVAHTRPERNYLKDYDHVYDSGDEDDEEFLLITTSGYSAVSARPHLVNNHPKSGMMSHSMYGTQTPVNNAKVPCDNALSQSFTSAVSSGGSCRQKIRTNPWIARGSHERLSSRSTVSAIQTPLRHLAHGTGSMVRRPDLNNRNMARPAQISGPLNGNPGLNPGPNPGSTSERKGDGWAQYASINRSVHLTGLNGLNDSACSASSGYGSQDSSPESSVHSPDWLPSSSLSSSSVGTTPPSAMLERHGILEDKAVDCHSFDEDPDEDEEEGQILDRNGNRKLGPSQYEAVSDEHIYHELECLNRLSLMLDDEQNNINTDLLMAASMDRSNSNLPGPQSARSYASKQEEPIYAVPYEHSGSFTDRGEYRKPFAVNSYRRLPLVPTGNPAGKYTPTSPMPSGHHLPQWTSTPRNNATFHPTYPGLVLYGSGSRVPGNMPPGGQSQVTQPRLRTGIIVRDLSFSSDSESESDSSEPEMQIEEEEQHSSTSCSSWTPMVTSQKGQRLMPAGYDMDGQVSGQSGKRRPDEFDFLAELDQQIVELQHKRRVRSLVEQAKERHELRSRTRQLCMEHLKELRKMRWFMHNNFELCL